MTVKRNRRLALGQAGADVVVNYVVGDEAANEVVDALRRNGIPVGYLLFSGEQHGFRKAANIKRALDAELLFYSVNVFRCGLGF